MGEPEFLTLTRSSYDTIAVAYAEHFRDELAHRPWDRAVLAVFAELVGSRSPGPVADVGCGTGHQTAHLHGLGVDVFGVDLSPGMLAVARRENPDIRFVEGSMLALDLPDGGLGGLLAYYSTIHVPDDRLPTVLDEFTRVLAPGGHLLLAFQAGEGVLRLSEGLGHEIALEFHRRRPERMAELVAEAGLTVRSVLVREAEEDERTAQAYLMALKPVTDDRSGSPASRAPTLVAGNDRHGGGRGMRLHPGEVEATGWQVEPLSDVGQRLRDAAPGVVGRPRLIAVDGRGGAGKSMLVERLRAAVPTSGVVHTDDIAWNQAYFDWGDLLVENVLRPLDRGEAVEFRPPAWIEHGRPGVIRVPSGVDVVWVEGTGTIREELAPWLDAAIWVQGDLDEQERRLVARDGDSAEQQRHVAAWLAEELPLLRRERPWQRATVVATGTPGLDHDPETEVVVAPPVVPRGAS